MTIIEQIKTEIERRVRSIENCPFIEAEFGASEKRDGKLIAYKDLLSFLSTLEESERPEPYNPVYDEAYLNEKIKKATESWKGVDVDAMLAECRGYDEEKSEKQIEGLEEEIKNYFQGYWPGTETAEQCNTHLHFTPPAIMRLARHFAQWGAEHARENEDIEFDSQFFGKVMSDILAVYKSPSNPEEEPLDYEWTIARQFYELGCRRAAEKYDEIEYNRQRTEESERPMDQEGLEEQCQMMADSLVQGLPIECAKAISDIKDRIVIAVRHGAFWQKEQMLKEAAEGEVVKDISNKLAVTAKINLDGFKFGDKVRVIVLPKEDEK